VIGLAGQNVLNKSLRQLSRWLVMLLHDGDVKGLFPNTAFDSFVQNVVEPPLRKTTNSRAI
jgi:hypothetical protein